MVIQCRKRNSSGAKRRFIGKPAGQIQERVEGVGPERFGIIAVDFNFDGATAGAVIDNMRRFREDVLAKV